MITQVKRIKKKRYIYNENVEIILKNVLKIAKY